MSIPGHGGAKLIPLIERISLDPITGCWNWKGARLPKGYGQVWYKGKTFTAHRLSAHLWLRFDLNDPRLVCHKCDNPSCFNPKHLFIGTKSDNAIDIVEKGKHHQARKTHCPKGHAYTTGNTLIRFSRNGRPRRDCKICRESYGRKNVSTSSN